MVTPKEIKQTMRSLLSPFILVLSQFNKLDHRISQVGRDLKGSSSPTPRSAARDACSVQIHSAIYWHVKKIFGVEVQDKKNNDK